MAVFALAAPAAALAAERTRIDEVSLTVESDITAGSCGGDVSVESDNTDLYDVSGVEVINAGKEWSEGDRPRVKITLEAVDAEEYCFASGSADMFTFSDSGAEYVTSVRGNDNAAITVTVKLSAVLDEDGSDEEDDEDDDSDDGDDTSYGSKSDWLNGTGVYESEDKTADSDEDEDTDSKDAANDDEEEADGPGTSGSSVVTSGEGTDGGPGSSAGSGSGSNVSSATATAGGSFAGGSSATWDSPQTGSGWVSDSVGWWYRNPDGSWPKDGWLKISDLWYSFDASGYLRYGWIKSGDDWYYCGTDGAMLVNAKTPDGYYVGGDGAWIR